VLAAGDENRRESRAALESLCSRYWYPLYAEVRFAGHDVEDARDLTQGFFAQLLERRTLAMASPDRGKFRNFLKTSIKHYLANQADRERALKRGGDLSSIPLDFAEAEQRYALDLSHDSSPDRVFDRRWARALLEQVLDRLREEMEQAGSLERFERLSPFLMTPGAAPGYRDLAIRWSTTEGAIKTAVHRLRRKFGKLLRQEVAHVVKDPRQVNDEIRFLIQALEP
jgi:RNA polymerase sigma-70 factor (ECF subfamily)